MLTLTTVGAIVTAIILKKSIDKKKEKDRAQEKDNSLPPSENNEWYTKVEIDAS